MCYFVIWKHFTPIVLLAVVTILVLPLAQCGNVLLLNGFGGGNGHEHHYDNDHYHDNYHHHENYHHDHHHQHEAAPLINGLDKGFALGMASLLGLFGDGNFIWGR